MERNPNYRVDSSKPHRRFYEPGQVVIRQGDPCDGVLYILSSGRVAIFRDGEQIAEISEPNVFFGEMSLVLDTPRTATVKTLTPCTIIAYEGGLERIIEARPSIAIKMLASLAQRLERTSHDHAQARIRIQELEQAIEQKEQQLQTMASKNEGLEQQNEKLKESIETLQRLLDQKQKEVDELSQRRGLFKRRRKTEASSSSS